MHLGLPITASLQDSKPRLCRSARCNSQPCQYVCRGTWTPLPPFFLREQFYQECSHSRGDYGSLHTFASKLLKAAESLSTSHVDAVIGRSALTLNFMAGVPQRAGQQTRPSRYLCSNFERKGKKVERHAFRVLQL